MEERAYSLLTIKSLDAEQRTISGIASTPDMDRDGHEIVMQGATYTNPIPLLLHHDRKQPVGRATLGAPTFEGIPFVATLPLIQESGVLKTRVDEAWHSIKAGLLHGVSVGFLAKENAIVRGKSGAVQFLKSEIIELSLVTIPSNVNASIRIVKQLAASGIYPSAVADIATKKSGPMTTSEQITQYSNARAPLVAKMADMTTAVADKNLTFDEPQAKEYDDLDGRVKGIDAHLTRLRALEASNVAAAVPVVVTHSIADASAVRGGTPVVRITSNVEKGTAFVRAACAMLVCKGNTFEAAEYAKRRWDDSTPEVALYLKAAVAPGNTTDATWAGPLVNTGISNDFLELLRPATILGKIAGLRTVPFNTKVPSQTAGGAYGWVGEAKPKPVTKLAFSADTLAIAKAAGIIILTEELVRLSNPSAEALARNDMIKGIAQFLDQQFIDPAVAAVAGVNPASITNGAPTAAATANPLADFLGLIAHFGANNIPVDGINVIMSAVNALSLSFYTNSDGSAMFPGVTMSGGNYKGINIITSQAAAGLVVALQPGLILYADDGGVTIDASREASVQMDSAPMSPADATTVLVSLWQNNLVGLRAERFINWKRANVNAVKYLTAAAYPAPTGIGGIGAGTVSAGSYAQTRPATTPPPVPPKV